MLAGLCCSAFAFASIARVIPRKFGPEKLHSRDAR
jgi:hypothetical protein